MSPADKLQQNIRRSAALHALKQINAIVKEEDKADASSADFLRWLLHYGWIALLIVAVLAAYLTGVY